MRSIPFAVLSALATATVLSSSLWASPASSGILSALQKKYVVADTTADSEQITKDGTTMVMKCAGIYSFPSTALAKPDNKVVDGKVQPPGMFVKAMLAKSSHVLQTGDKVYITKMEIKSEPGGDSLRMALLTVDSLDVTGSDAKKKYDATVSFKFKKGYLDETPPEEVEQVIESVLAPDAGADEAGGGQQAQEQAPAAPARPAPRLPQKAAPQAAQPAAPSAAQQAAPPAAPAGPPATISIGESSTQVLQAMGMPQQMIDLGKKKTFVYKNMKIVFIDDKVSDVQ